MRTVAYINRGKVTTSLAEALLMPSRRMVLVPVTNKPITSKETREKRIAGIRAKCAANK